MRLIYWCLACVLSLLHLTGFAGELKQGTLKNGIRYYLYSDRFERETTVAIAVKNTEQEAYLPFPFIFDLGKDGDRMFHFRARSKQLNHRSIAGSTYRSASEALSYVATYLKNDVFPQEVIDNLRQDYQEDLEEMDVNEKKREEVGKFLCGDYPTFEAAFFAKSDEEISALCRGLFKPSKMAIVVTGSFDLTEMEKQLQLLFEDIKENEILIDEFPFLPSMPVAITLKGKGILDEVFTEEDPEVDAEEQEVSLYWYRLAPSLKNYVLNDLFFFTQFDPNLPFVSNQVGEFDLDYYFPFVGQMPRFEVDERALNLAKEELKKKYEEQEFAIYETCVNHFVFEISEDLELGNQNLLSELEAVRPEDLKAFISETIQDIPIAREFNLN